MAEDQSRRIDGSYSLILGALGSILGVLSIRLRYQQKQEERSAGEVVVTPEFRKFQCSFMRVYLTALATEWLQASYLFVMLSEYHGESSVARIYLAGVASQLTLTVLLEVMGGFVPHKLRSGACLAFQAISACLLLHPAFGGLVTSRVLGGLASALLNSSFEAWMVEQHVGQGFPLDWFTDTFNILSTVMSALALFVGPITMVAHDVGGGSTGPSKLSLICVVVNALQLLAWRRDANKSCPAYADNVRLVSHSFGALGDGKVALVVTAQSCFEATIMAFALLWTPLIRDAIPRTPEDANEIEAPWGIIFSQQLVCVMIGSVLFKLTTSLLPGFTVERLCLWASVIAACFFFLLAFMPFAGVVQRALLGFEVCVGIYLNAMGVIRSKHIPQEVRAMVLAIGKLVITVALFICFVFVAETRSVAAGLCGVLLVISALCTKLATASGAVESSNTGEGGEGDATLVQKR